MIEADINVVILLQLVNASEMTASLTDVGLLVSVLTDQLNVESNWLSTLIHVKKSIR